MAEVKSWEDFWQSLEGAEPYKAATAWLAQSASPLVPISSAYKENINESLENLNTILPKYSNFVTGLPDTFNQLATNTQQKFEPTFSNLSNVYNQVFGNLSSTLNTAQTRTPQFYSTLNNAYNALRDVTNRANIEIEGTKPIIGSSIGNLMDLYQQIRGTIANAPTNNEMLNQVWQQYGDVYNALRSAQQRTQTGELSPATQEWINRLGSSLRQEMDTELSDVYRNDIRGLLANLAERGIVTSDQANRAFTQAADKYLKQKQLGESKIAQTLAQAALQLPFQQFSAAKEALAAPQTGGNLAALYSTVFSKLAPFYEIAMKAAAAPATTTTDYLGKVAAILEPQAYTGKFLSDAAANVYQPELTNAELAKALASAATSAGQTQYGAMSAITNALTNVLAQGAGASHTGFANLIEQYTQTPEQLLGKAFDRYGGIGTLLAKMLTDKYLKEKELETQAKIANKKISMDADAADAAADAALWSAIGGLVGDIFF